MGSADCCPIQNNLLSYDEAIGQLLAAARPLPGCETMPLHQALGRVLAKSLFSTIPVPPWDNSAMDGYAVRFQDLDGPGVSLPVQQRIAAGQTGQPLQPGMAARIFTGAPLPDGADTVVIQEVCEQQGDRVLIRELPRQGANVRRAGEDIHAGSEILSAGTRLWPQHLGLAASIGVSQLEVFPSVRVALLASGDELAMPGEPLGPGQIYDSNQFTASGMLRSLGCEPVLLGRVADNLDATCAALAQGAASADLVLSSGGVSVGEEDHVKPALERLGRLDLWRIAIRPGKPLAFGHIGETPFIGLPGNPVSLFVTFLLFVRPFLLRMQGLNNPLPQPVMVEADFDWPKPDKRREFARARLMTSADGKISVGLYPSRSSAVLSSAVWADGLVVLPEMQVIQRGDAVQFLSFKELLS